MNPRNSNGERWLDVRSRQTQMEALDRKLNLVLAGQAREWTPRPLSRKTRWRLGILALILLAAVASAVVNAADQSQNTTDVSTLGQQASVLQQELNSTETEATDLDVESVQFIELGQTADAGKASAQAQSAIKEALHAQTQVTNADKAWAAAISTDSESGGQLTAIVFASIFSVILGGLASFFIVRMVEARLI